VNERLRAIGFFITSSLSCDSLLSNTTIFTADLSPFELADSDLLSGAQTKEQVEIKSPQIAALNDV
jgi:hypothetical protein